MALAVGATIVNRVEDLRESDVDTGCGLFHIEKFGYECVLMSIVRDSLHSRSFAFLAACTNPKVCTILLCGPSRNILNEMDRNFTDALACN